MRYNLMETIKTEPDKMFTFFFKMVVVYLGWSRLSEIGIIQNQKVKTFRF